jgi:hypothetical protein
LKEKAFFFEKKKQKTSIHLASASPDRLSPNNKKFFGSFFEKEHPYFEPTVQGAVKCPKTA